MKSNWDECDLWTQCQVLAYEQIRSYEESEEAGLTLQALLMPRL